MRWFVKPRSLSRETCLNVVRKQLFQATSNWLYVLHLQDMPDRRFAGLFCVGILYRGGQAAVEVFLCAGENKSFRLDCPLHDHNLQTIE